MGTGITTAVSLCERGDGQLFTKELRKVSRLYGNPTSVSLVATFPGFLARRYMYKITKRKREKSKKHSTIFVREINTLSGKDTMMR